MDRMTLWVQFDATCNKTASTTEIQFPLYRRSCAIYGAQRFSAAHHNKNNLFEFQISSSCKLRNGIKIMSILRAFESVQALIMLNYSVEGRLYCQAQAAGTKVLLKTRQSSQVCRNQRQGTNLSPIDRELTIVWASTCHQHFMTKPSLGRQEIYLTAVLKQAEVPNTALSFRDSTFFFFLIPVLGNLLSYFLIHPLRLPSLRTPSTTWRVGWAKVCRSRRCCGRSRPVTETSRRATMIGSTFGQQ